jgi:RNA polymerase sigma factor (sigma-70 family)
VANAFVNQRRRPSSREVAVEFLPENHDPFDATTQLADRSELSQLLSELPDRQRAALVLRFFHDLPDGEIAEALQCRIGTVRSLISRGLTTMRERSTQTDTAWPAPRRDQ